MTLGFLIRVSSERANFMAFEMLHVMYEAFVDDGVENRRIVTHERELSGLAFHRIRGWRGITFDFHSQKAEQQKNSINGQSQSGDGED